MAEQINRAAAFRAVFGYLRTVNTRVTEVAFKAMRPAGSDDAKLLIQATRSNVQTGDQSWLPVAIEALSELVAREGIKIPAAIDPLWRAMQPGSLDSYAIAQDNGFPFFLNEAHLQRFYEERRLQRPEIFLGRYGGSWRVYRPSSSKGKRQMHRSFLNIKPLGVLETQQRLTPQFSLYSVREGESGGTSGFSARGSMFVADDVMILLGARVGKDTPVLLVWRHAVDAATRQTPPETVQGLIYTSNSDGRPIVTGFLARYIPGSRDKIGEAYDALRDDERAKAGTFALSDLNGEVSDADLDAIAAMRRGEHVLSL